MNMSIDPMIYFGSIAIFIDSWMGPWIYEHVDRFLDESKDILQTSA